MKVSTYIIVLFLLLSCSQELRLEETISDFDADHSIFIEIKEQRSLSTNYNVKIEGEISNKIKISNINHPNEILHSFDVYPDSLPISFSSDYYGSPGKIGFFIPKSPDVNGSLTVTISIP